MTLWTRCKTGALAISLLIVGGFVFCEITNNASPALEAMAYMVSGVWFGRYTKAKETKKL